MWKVIKYALSERGGQLLTLVLSVCVGSALLSINLSQPIFGSFIGGLLVGGSVLAPLECFCDYGMKDLNAPRVSDRLLCLPAKPIDKFAGMIVYSAVIIPLSALLVGVLTITARIAIGQAIGEDTTGAVERIIGSGATADWIVSMLCVYLIGCSTSLYCALLPNVLLRFGVPLVLLSLLLILGCFLDNLGLPMSPAVAATFAALTLVISPILVRSAFLRFKNYDITA